MSDNLKKTGIQDQIRINIHESWELDYWSTKFGIKPDRLKTAVSAVGPLVKNVREWLLNNGHIKTSD